MNIRKIILEEMDSFDWVDTVPDITKGVCIEDHLHRQGSTYKVVGVKDGIVYLDNNDTHRLREIPKDVLMDRLELKAITICDSINESEFDWADEIPNNKTVGEIKSTDRGFRDFFDVGDTLIIDDGQIPCESIRNEGCFINLTNSEYRVTNVYRTRVEIRPLNPETVNIFIDEWGEDKVWVGVESSDDDIQLHKKPTY